MTEPITPALLDRQALTDLLEMTGDDHAFLTEMIDTFLEDSPKLLADMQISLGTGDAGGLRRAAHTLKSSSHTFGATRMGDLCHEIEKRAASGDLRGLESLVRDSATEYVAVEAALMAERTEA